MRISRHFCPQCQDTVLFSGLMHLKCGYVMPLKPLWPVDMHSKGRTILPQTKAAVRRRYREGLTKAALAKEFHISVKSVRLIVQGLPQI